MKVCGATVGPGNSSITCELKAEHDDVWHRCGVVVWNYDGRELKSEEARRPAGQGEERGGSGRMVLESFPEAPSSKQSGKAGSKEEPLSLRQGPSKGSKLNRRDGWELWW